MRAASICRFALFGVLFAQLTVPTAWGQESFGQKYALLVGCRYLDNKKELNPLAYTHNDILEFAEILRKRGFAKDNIVLMYDGQGVKPRLLPESKKIQEQVGLLLERLRPEDTVIVALSGHGVQFKGEKGNYFCPLDAELKDRDTLLALDGLYKQLEECKAQRKLLVVDACRNDPLTPLGKGGRPVRDLQPDPVPGGIVALFSCGPGQQSYEYPKEANIKHSIFFHHFLDAWNSEAVDTDGKLTLSRLVEYTFRHTSDTAATVIFAKQHPQQQNGPVGVWVLWERKIGELRTIEARRGGVIQSVALSADGRYALSGGNDNKVRLWALETGDELKELKCLPGHRGWVRSVAFSPDGSQAVSGSNDTTVRLWDLENGQPLKLFKEHRDAVLCVAFSPDGKYVLSAGDDLTVRLWDVNTGQQLYCLREHTEPVWSVAFAPNGRQFLSGSADKTIRLWDVQTGTQLRCFTGHTGGVQSVAFAPNSREFLSGSDDKTVCLWKVNGAEPLMTFTDHTQPVISVAFSPDGRMALTGGADYTVRLFDLTKGVQRECFRGHTDIVLSVVFSPDRPQALTGSLDKTIRLWGLPRK
jgi:hypothetical protein